MSALSKHKAAARETYADAIRKGAPPRQTKILPEPDARVIAAIGWERSTPRCEICRHCQGAKTLLNKQTTRLPVVLVPPVCRRGKFYTRPGAICDFWVGRDGSSLQDDSRAAIAAATKEQTP